MLSIAAAARIERQAAADTETDSNPTCAAGNFAIYVDLSENKLKKCVNGAVTDL